MDTEDADPGESRPPTLADLLVDGSLENQSRVKKSLEILPDKAVVEIAGDDLNDYVVIRVGNEITVDLMAAACGVRYEDAVKD